MNKSDKITKKSIRAPHRSLLYAIGLEEEDFDKPFIGIANSYNETVPGHVHLRRYVEYLKEGIYKNGGIPFEFNTIGICDGLAMNHEGMSYSLTSRQIICDSIVTQVNGFAFDGIVFVPNCDKVTPGMMMAAAKLNLPSVFISGGPMLAGKVDNMNASLTTLFEAVGSYEQGLIDDDKLKEYEQNACPTCGSCSGMYTANTMNCLCEVLGIAQIGNGSVPAVYSKRVRMFKNAGRIIMDLVNKDKKFSDIVSKDNFLNAIACDMAMTGSTNTILHLLAVAKYSNVDISLYDFDRLSNEIPQLTKLSPASDQAIEDFEDAGGMMALINELSKHNKIIDTPTILGDSLIRQASNHPILDSNVIKTFDTAYNNNGGLSVLYGNIAENGAIVKNGAVDKNQMYHKGYARVFENEDECVEYLQTNQFDDTNLVLVIRNMGIKGGYGMPEMLTPTSLIKGLNISRHVALITDGRFSGGSNGLVIGHVSPEASEGGLIALIKNNDLIEIDLTNKKMELLVDDNEITSRAKDFVKNIKISNNYLDIYTKLAENASKGGAVQQ